MEKESKIHNTSMALLSLKSTWSDIPRGRKSQYLN